jgi:hypothetical protein
MTREGAKLPCSKVGDDPNRTGTIYEIERPNKARRMEKECPPIQFSVRLYVKETRLAFLNWEDFTWQLSYLIIT